ncbi:AT-rich interactive domain-containing protein 2-like [Aristolochia californica]|uniref:AT-rich interactive domain-containing protein 2-like n=1 Tax=Aristolochia californica TaxID=171875 RepID=UPI0035D69274
MKKQRMHPSICEDYVGSDQKGIRCSLTLLSSQMAPSSASCSNKPMDSEGDSEKTLLPYSVRPAKRVLRTYATLNRETVVGLFCKDQLQKRVPIGPFFQVKVPTWTGPTACTSDDIKWLGIQHWPLEVNQHNTSVDREVIGKGRPNSCGCRLPGSVECVRFHVAERRILLNRELGPAFYHWKFHCMGEEVSLSWTDDEEKRFKTIVQLNPPSLERSFWEPIHRSFPSKSTQSLVNYYFNVFLLRRRSYQNRVTPNNIDSDDDESEFGFLGGSFGHEMMKAYDNGISLCSQNRQCQYPGDSVDLDPEEDKELSVVGN